ncbi:MAG: D-alanyl-D-alanine carboxypeptidase/D-alanyl-D-alanine-endopeptidase [Pseudomonadota bacterium]
MKTVFTITGLVPAEGDTDRYYRAVGDASAYFTGAFAELCKQHGIKVHGRYIDGSTPDDATLLVRQSSPPLGTILQTMDKQSNNLMAEAVLQAMGVAVHGAPGSTASGLEVVASYLHDLGIPDDSFHLVNGSGLSREAVLRPEVLTAVLLDMDQDRLVGPEFRAALSIGGLDGTLRRRFAADELAGRVRGKTGSLNGVYCLTGYVDASDGTTYAFAMLLNDIHGPLSRARRVQDAFVGALLASGEAIDLAAVEDTAVEGGEEDEAEQ